MTGRIMRRGAHLLVLAAAIILGACGPSGAQNWFASANGNTVDAYSALIPGFAVTDMFGTTLGTVEAGNTIFVDGLPEFTTHYVEFHTAQLVDIYTVNLYATGDAGSNYPDYRDFLTFNLYAGQTPGSLTQYIGYSPGHPEVPETLPLQHTFGIGAGSPITAQYFRAEFLQYQAGGPGNGLGGPRILELEGYGTISAQQPVPEPGALAFAGVLTFGGLTLALRGRRTR
ncbi:MAG: hypothetical protein IT208_10950 [Chthonomonadales bacterium]|nr:hypothetical protein [Chthonomonadales bacterium]